MPGVDRFIAIHLHSGNTWFSIKMQGTGLFMQMHIFNYANAQIMQMNNSCSAPI
jgi:hypothetical protein